MNMTFRPGSLLKPSVLLAVAVAGLLGACSTEQRVRAQAQETLNKGEFEESVRLLEDGLKANPDSIILRSHLLTTKGAAIESLIGEALILRKAGKFPEARVSLQRALVLDPINARVFAIQDELTTQARQDQMLQTALGLETSGKSEQALRTAEQGLKDNPRHDGLIILQRRISALMRSKQVSAAQASLSETRPISLDFNEASLRAVLDLVSRNSGINFVLDKDIRTDARVTVYLKNAKVEEALDLIINANQLAKKVLDSKTIAIYPNTPEKHKDYQEQIVRVFYLAGSDAKNAASFLRSMLKIKEPFVEERTNMLAIRDSQENVQLAEKLIALFDAGEPEVLLEVEVLEVSSKRMLQLGVNPPTSFSLSLLAPSGTSGYTLGNIGNVRPDNVGVGVGNATVNFKRELGDFTTLANPKIRVRNKEKATVMVGDKIPVVTTTTGIGGFVSDNVTYLDVGLKLNVEPTIYSDDDVAVRMSLEVSTLGTAVRTNSGTLAYQIGTRNATTVLRLKDGETQMLAGLISKEDRASVTGLPGAADLPVLGRLFSDQQNSSNKTELVLAITPRVLRNIRKPEAHEAEVWVGTESAPKLRPYGGLRPDLSATNAEIPKTAGTQAAASGSSNPQVAANAGYSDGSASLPLTLTWLAPPPVKVGEFFEVGVSLKTDTPLRGLPIDLIFDKTKLQLLDATEGDFFNQQGAATSFSKGEQDALGRMTLGLIRRQATGASGQGTAYRLKFKALSAGAAELQVPKVTPIAIGGAWTDIAPLHPLVVQVLP